MVGVSILPVPVQADLDPEQIHQELVTHVKADFAVKAGQIDRAFTLWQELAALKNTEGLRKLGIAYQQGLGTSVNMARAVALLQEAADQGDAAALYALSKLYAEGQYVDGSQRLAAALLWEAAAVGSLEGAYELGVICVEAGHIDRGKMWLDRAAAGGITEAKARLKTLPSSSEPVLSNEERRALNQLVQELNAAVNTRDTFMLLATVADNARIDVELPGGDGTQALSKEDYRVLWQEVFNASERFRVNRWLAEPTRLSEQQLRLESHMLQYVRGPEVFEKLALTETLVIDDLLNRPRISAVSLRAELRPDTLAIENSTATDECLIAPY
jgi:TPR repeat protein